VSARPSPISLAVLARDIDRRVTSREKRSRDADALGKLPADSGADPALAVEDVGEGRHGAARAPRQLSLGQGVLLHEVAKALHGREFRMLVDRVFVVGEKGTHPPAPNSASRRKKIAFFSSAGSLRCCGSRTAEL